MSKFVSVNSQNEVILWVVSDWTLSCMKWGRNNFKFVKGTIELQGRLLGSFFVSFEKSKLSKNHLRLLKLSIPNSNSSNFPIQYPERQQKEETSFSYIQWRGNHYQSGGYKSGNRSIPQSNSNDCCAGKTYQTWYTNWNTASNRWFIETHASE